MAWEARSGLKRTASSRLSVLRERLNGLGSPFGIETMSIRVADNLTQGLNGLGSPFGIETTHTSSQHWKHARLNGLGNPFGFETIARRLGAQE